MACAAMRTAAGEGDDLMKEISVFLFPKNSLTDCG
jgi:predicted RecA/RadA family phage recombinase